MNNFLPNIIRSLKQRKHSFITSKVNICNSFFYCFWSLLQCPCETPMFFILSIVLENWNMNINTTRSDKSWFFTFLSTHFAIHPPCYRINFSPDDVDDGVEVGSSCCAFLKSIIQRHFCLFAMWRLDSQFLSIILRQTIFGTNKKINLNHEQRGLQSCLMNFLSNLTYHHRLSNSDPSDKWIEIGSEFVIGE